MGEMLPIVAMNPAGTQMQASDDVAPVRLDAVPPAQGWGTVAPSTQNAPAGQVKQPVCPSSG
jgi:hypothetical protein